MNENIKPFVSHRHKASKKTLVTKKPKVEETISMLGAMKNSKKYSQVEVERIRGELLQFDLNTKYGPVSGLSRMQRWQRAKSLFLEPPVEIEEYLQDVELQKCLPDLNYHLWSGIIDIRLPE